MKRILVTGSKGQLGREIVKRKDNLPGTEFFFMDIDELDLTDSRSVEQTMKVLKPSVLINCAAYTAVDRAEEDEGNAFEVNAGAVKNIVKAAASGAGIKLLHISTDFVFDGKKKTPYTEDDSTEPLSAYGRSKLSGEKYALSYPYSIIIRTSWLYSEYGSNFVKTILRLADQKDEINVVDDQTGTPTWAGDLASTVLTIAGKAMDNEGHFTPGIYHFSNLGQCTWYDFACEIKKTMNLDLIINPVSTDQYPLPAKRPPYSVMSLEKIKNTYNIEIPYWQDSLEICLKSISRKNER